MRIESSGLSANGKKLVFLFMTIFLLLFPHYAPFGNHVIQEHTLIQKVFNLYFFIANQTLGMIHESGHGICYILHCPEFITAINGTVFQVAFPLGVAYYYLYKNNKFAYFIALFFVGFSLSYTAWYISTAHEGLFIPAYKSFLGVDGKHDFNYILDTMGLLAYDGVISIIIKIGAYMIMVRSVIGIFFEAFKT